MEYFKKIWFQLHWFVGITAGTVLIAIGLTGAVLSFREELIDAMNPGGRHVGANTSPLLAPSQLLEAAGKVHGERSVATLALFAQPGAAARIVFSPPRGERRGETIYLNPYTGAALPPLVGEAFFEWNESLHRWLLLPRAQGKVATGVLSGGLLMLALSGLYLRWPKRVLDWRAWFTFDPALKGRSFLWSLHSVLGTFALLMYLVFTTTGLYWAFDVIRDRVDAWAGVPADAPRVRSMGNSNAAAMDIAPAWTAFLQRAGRTSGGAAGWSQVVLRLPTGTGPSVLFTWLDAVPSHERARNRMTVRLPDGEIIQDERHNAKDAGGLFLAAIYPLHMGTYFGLPGRIAMMLASLMLPVFSVTGWLLYLDRRRKKKSLREQRAQMSKHSGAGSDGKPGTREGVLVAFASQSGTAERFALRSAAVLEAAGVPVTVRSVATLDAEQLRHHRRALIVASTFGEGDPPDMARRFARQMAQAGLSLPHLQYGVLALGDRHFARFCGFGRTLDHSLSAAGARALFPMVEVDEGDTAALGRWSKHLHAVIQSDHIADTESPAGFSVTGSAFLPPENQPFSQWRLSSRDLLNPGSLGAPLYRVVLEPISDESVHWEAGALVEVQPRHAVPAPDTHPLAPRRYSVASLPGDGRIELLVRQVRHETGLGVASGWLTVHAPIGADIALRLLPNPAFGPAEGDFPCVFIGNGSGYAGLRGHLLARIAAGQRRNWVLYGERQSAFDSACVDELTRWRSRGDLAQVDAVFSRDQIERVYVQDRLRAAPAMLREWIASGAVVYVCGSLDGMAAGVDAALSEVLGATGLDDLIAEGRYRRDVY
ncbi:PepSY domain-containing protein [Variovorax sp. RHLX14]|uniref:PepSY domain-containing protein n=1 Tax=Variovorax sp. RHLX14 TaxID=1259731 RepID=UPI003F473073